MKNKTKKMKCTYYEVVSMDENGDEVLYDLRLWLMRIVGKTLPERKKEMDSGYEGRLENSIRIQQDVYALNFMKLDVASDTYKVKEDMRAEHIDLEDDEYIGKNTVALYDPQNHIMMVQRNRGSFNAPAIETYINQTNEDEICYLRPITRQFNIAECTNHVVRKINVVCSNIRQFETGGSATFERIIEACNDLNALTVHLEIGLGYDRGASLNNETVYEVANIIQRNAGCVSSAKVTILDDEKQCVYDLFHNWDYDTLTFIVPERAELDFEYVAQKMYEVYSAKR